MTELITSKALGEWHDVEVDGLPPCDDERVFVGYSSQGFSACFNHVRPDGLCMMGGPETSTAQMNGLRYWRELEEPFAERVRGVPVGAIYRTMLAVAPAAPHHSGGATELVALRDECADICKSLRCTPEFREEIQDKMLRIAEERIRALRLSAAPAPVVDEPVARLPIRGVGRMVDNKKAVLVMFDRELTDDELRTIDDVLHAARPAADVLAASPMSQAARDVLAERQRQITAEGWTPEHDDVHEQGQLADAAGCYALIASIPEAQRPRSVPMFWPLTWHRSWWKPSDRRRDLVKSGALILAELERLDRDASRAKGGA